MVLLDFVAIVLASGAIIDVWNNGSILAEPRAWVQAVADSGQARLQLLWELLNCSYCLSYHVPLYLLLGTWLCPWADVAWLLVYALAATRAALLLNELLPERIRYVRPLFLPAARPQPDKEDPDDYRPEC